MTKKDFFTSLVLIAFGAAVLTESLRMPRFENLGINPYTVPGIVPGVLGGVIILLGAIMFVRSSFVDSWRVAPKPTEPSAALRKGSQRLTLTLLLTIGYAGGLVGRLPFWAATFIFVFLFIALFEWRRTHVAVKQLRILGVALIEAALVSAAVTYVFERIFLVRLP